MIKAKLDKQHYEWLSDDIREKIGGIVEWGYSDDELLDCVNDLVFIKTFSQEGYECKDENEVRELGKRIRKMVREYDKHSNLKLRIISGANENEAVVFIYDL